MFGPGEVAIELADQAGESFGLLAGFFPLASRPATANNPLFLKKSRRVHLEIGMLIFPPWSVLYPLRFAALTAMRESCSSVLVSLSKLCCRVVRAGKPFLKKVR